MALGEDSSAGVKRHIYSVRLRYKKGENSIEESDKTKR